MYINRCPKCGREPSILIWRRDDDEETISGYEAECYDCGNTETAKYMNDIISIVQATLAKPPRDDES